MIYFGWIMLEIFQYAIASWQYSFSFEGHMQGSSHRKRSLDDRELPFDY